MTSNQIIIMKMKGIKYKFSHCIIKPNYRISVKKNVEHVNLLGNQNIL